MQKNKGELILLKCKRCKNLIMPPRSNCPKCSGTEFESELASGIGNIRTYTTIQLSPLGFESQVPYKIALVELKEGINITVRLAANLGKEPAIGEKVKFLKKEDGAYWFQY